MTVRALILGLLMVLTVTAAGPYSIWIVGSSEVTWSVFPIGVGVPFVALVAVNACLARLRRAWVLAPGELVTVLVMGLVASGIPIFVVGYVLAVISKPYYGATPENEWASFVQPYLPDWAIPGRGQEAMRHFYEGLPAGAPLPWGVWLQPLLWWFSLLLALHLLCFCLVVVLRRQWTEHERLTYPVAEFARLLLEQDARSALPTVFRAQVFWVGCAIPFGVILFNMASYFYPGFPQLGVHRGFSVQLFDGTLPLPLLLYFPVVGFMYFVGTGVSFSIWILYLLTLAESGLVAWTGLTVSRPDEFVWDWQTLSWQAYGAFVAMVGWSLWVARHHLVAVARHVSGHGRRLDDTTELMPYRAAVVAGLLALTYVALWFWRAGMEPGVVALYVAGLVVMYLGFTRLVIQAGLHYLTPPMNPQALTVAVTGTDIAPRSLVGLALSHGIHGDVESLFMPAAAHGARLSETYPCRRGLSLAVGMAVLVSFVVATALILHLCYQYGAGNLRSWFFQAGAGAGGKAFDAVVRQLRDPWPSDWGKLAYFAIGGSLYSLLSVCQYRFYWWPLHPVGLTVATTWMVRRTVLSVFVAWLLKVVILRLGGVRLYRELRPFFVGLIVGFFAGVGVSYAVDVIWFFGRGHPILHG